MSARCRKDGRIGRPNERDGTRRGDASEREREREREREKRAVDRERNRGAIETLEEK